jgi:signal transduction histidine kinase
MRRLLSLSIRAKLMLFSAVLVLVPGSVAAILAIAGARRALENAVGRQLAAVAHDTATEISEMLARERQTVSTWAHQEVMRELVIGDLDKRVSRFLASQKDGGAPYLDVLCTDLGGRVIAATSPLLLGDQQGRQNWARAALGGSTFLAGPKHRPGYERPVVEIAAPIVDPERGGFVIGALLGLYDWGQASELAERVQKNQAALRLAVDLLIVDDAGVVIAAAPSVHGTGGIGRNLRAAGWQSVQRGAVPQGPVFVRDPVAAVLVGSAAVPDGQQRWRVLAAQPLEKALAPVARLQRRLLLVLGGVLLAALGVAMLLAERLSRPVRALTAATREIGRAGGIRRPVEVRSGDEIGELAASFNAMAGQLTDAREQLVTAAKFAFVGEVAAGIAHEIRTPLGILRGSAQILARSLPADRPEAGELIDMIVSEVDRLDRVVAGLLEIARPRAPQIAPTSIAGVVARALDFLDAQARKQHVTLRGEFAPYLRPARCDAEQIYQVALNLLVNALQAVPEGGTIIARTVSGGDGRVGFEVSDNGPGIPEDIRERIFTPFFTRREGGTGLGLALVQRIVQSHNGTVSVESQPGRGTTFRVELPAAGSGESS